MQFRDFSLLVRDTKVRGFADGLERGELRASRCTGCGTVQFPPRSDCPACLSGEFEWEAISGTGRLVTYTLIKVPPRHFAPDLSCRAPFSKYMYAPAAVGLIEMNDGLRVMGWVCGVAPQDLQVGMMLTPQPEVLDDGRATIVLKSEGC